MFFFSPHKLCTRGNEAYNGEEILSQLPPSYTASYGDERWPTEVTSKTYFRSCPSTAKHQMFISFFSDSDILCSLTARSASGLPDYYVKNHSNEGSWEGHLRQTQIGSLTSPGDWHWTVSFCDYVYPPHVSTTTHARTVEIDPNASSVARHTSAVSNNDIIYWS